MRCTLLSVWILYFTSVSLLKDTTAEDPQIEAVRGLIHRLAPKYEQLFTLELLDSNEWGLDRFEVESAENNKITLRGTSGVAIASAFNWYLKEKCHSSVSWLGNNIHIPDPLPTVTPKVVQSTNHKYRYYLNTCTFGYSMSWWNFTDWEREIDWMALHGINLPLSFVGQELIWYDVFVNQLGLSPNDLEDFFTGPAFLPWQRMGNIYKWEGPLPMSWMKQQSELQKQILKRQRDFGMKAILPGFAGHVPANIKNKYPNASISSVSSWGDFPPEYKTFFLAPMDPLFVTIGTLFIKRQEQFYGTDHIYNADPFNEVNPPTNNTTFIANVGKTIWESISGADPAAVWILQGWFLLNAKDFWQPPQARAFLTSVPYDRLIVLDLWAEVLPMWEQTEGFYGQQFIWCMLNNFGGRSGMYGTLPRVNQGPFTAMNDKRNHVVGLGLTPEAIGTNPIMYDLLTDLIWEEQPVNLDEWVYNYIFSRYGQVTPDVLKAWRLLQYSVYNCTTNQEGTTGSIIAARPGLNRTHNGCCAGLVPFYNTDDIRKAWTLLVGSISNYESSETYATDLVMVTTQVLTDIAFDVYQDINEAYDKSNITAIRELKDSFIGIFDDMDQLLSSSSFYLLGNWLEEAKSWGTNQYEKNLYELNARTQITLWAPFPSHLHDYAYHLWGGMVSDFYKPRWSLFFFELEQAMASGKPFNETSFDYDVGTRVEESWTKQHKAFPTYPRGDTFTVAKEIFNKYQL